MFSIESHPGIFDQIGLSIGSCELTKKYNNNYHIIVSQEFTKLYKCVWKLRDWNFYRWQWIGRLGIAKDDSTVFVSVYD